MKYNNSSILLALSLYPSSASNTNSASPYFPASISAIALLYLPLGIITVFKTIIKAITAQTIGVVIMAIFLFRFAMRSASLRAISAYSGYFFSTLQAEFCILRKRSATLGTLII